jgi:hypothetical protein
MPKNQNELGRCSGSQKQPWLITLLGSAALLGACDGVPSEVEQNAGEVITGEEVSSLGPDVTPRCITLKEGGATSCKDEKTWRSYGEAACKMKSLALKSVTFATSCGMASWREASYTCCDSITPPPPPPPPPPLECASPRSSAPLPVSASRTPIGRTRRTPSASPRVFPSSPCPLALPAEAGTLMSRSSAVGCQRRLLHRLLRRRLLLRQACASRSGSRTRWASVSMTALGRPAPKRSAGPRAPRSRACPLAPPVGVDTSMSRSSAVGQRRHRLRHRHRRHRLQLVASGVRCQARESVACRRCGSEKP